jgi:heptosyltransferase-2
MVTAPGTNPDPTPPLRERLPAGLLARGRERLERAGWRADRELPLAFLLLAIDGAPARRWPWTRWVEVAQGLRRFQPPCAVVALTTPDELWPAVRVHEACGRIVPVLGPDLDAALVVAVLAHGSLAIGADTGQLRLAASMGLATIGVYGPTDPYRDPPRGDRHVAVFAPRWCAPCGLRRCLLLHQRCLADLPAEPVLEAARRQLTP